jgi:putative intracellular protease/amidase
MSHVLVVCARRYNGHELWTALGVMQEAGITFEVVSQDVRIEDEVTNQPNIIGRKVYNVSPEEMHSKFDGIMIVSGNMYDTEKYWDDKHVLDLIAETNTLGKAVAAICCSVPTIRYAAKDKKVSFYPLVRSRERLRTAGAILQSVAWTVDGNLVTAEHQMATQAWAEAYVKVLRGEKVENYLVDSKYMPRGFERKPIPEVERLKKLQKQNKGEA